MSKRSRRPTRRARNDYVKAVKRHERNVDRVSKELATRLADSSVSTAMGLPEELPQSTRTILGQSLASSHLGGYRPRRDQFTASTAAPNVRWTLILEPPPPSGPTCPWPAEGLYEAMSAPTELARYTGKGRRHAKA